MYTGCTYKLKRKPLFDGLVLGVLNIKGQFMIYTTEHIRSVNLGMDGQSEWLLCTVIKIGYGLFSYALQPAKRTSASFMGAILEEYLVLIVFLLSQPCT